MSKRKLLAISNHRIQMVDNQTVTFDYKDYKTGGNQKQMTLTTTEFIRRFAQHILPPRFRRIRHYGFLSNAAKSKSLEKARQSLNMQSRQRMDKAQRREAARERLLGINSNRCPCCREGTMHRIGILPPMAHQAGSMTRAPPTAGQDLQNAIWIDFVIQEKSDAAKTCSTSDSMGYV